MEAPRTREPDPVDLTWVAEWIRNVSDYVFVREDDRLFIQRPNKAFKLNPAGVAIMKRLLAGESVAEILAPHRGHPHAARDLERFLLDLRKLLKEGIDDTYESPAVTKIPFTMQFSKLPVLSEVAVTYRCNAACTFCYAGCNCTVNPVGSSEEMTLEEIRRVLDKIARQAKVPSVSFTGGEATLRPDLPDMVRHARGLGMRVNLITNGISASSMAFVQTLSDAGLQSAQVSVEGTTAAVHESITRIRGSFAQATQAVRNFSAAGLTVHTNTTLTRTNLEDAAEFPAFVRHGLGLGTFSMNLVIPTGSAALNGGLQVRYRELGPHLEEILRRSRELGVEFYWYSPTPMCIFNPITHGLGNKGCSACDGLLSVGADGRVLPCASYDEPVGDLLGGSFDEVWQSGPARDFRRKFLAHDICKACENFHICNGACPLYWRQMGFAELVEAQRGRA
ncbi:MAG: radical SAM protein [Planctomycetota bacterium]|jgi:radical SAM protein with 4Fe4S-binding SPASM domain